ncbi:MAG TPA: dethiobiotin synthase [Chryseolinea sp.]|nr:dethiobiotin synthase [Chryseolinea sp.]
MDYFITGIDTDSGKTLVSAIFCEALDADYWKPVQAGAPRDSDTVSMLVSNPKINIHKEAFFLNTPASPHAAAKLDGISINLSDFIRPTSERDLIIEGAGGCLVPLNETDFVIDLAGHFKAEVVLVADLYLGSINHTLLTWRELSSRRLNVKGIVFNGRSNPESERIILHHTSLPCLLRIDQEEKIDKQVVKKYSTLLKSAWL